MSNSNTFSRDNKAAKSNKGIARPKDKIIGNSSTEDWLNDFDDDLSMMGYRDDSPYRERSSIDIHTPTGMIDMSQTGIPLMANGQYLPPYSGIHNMGTPYVREERMAKYGGWLDQYAPGGTPGKPPLKPKLGLKTGPGRYRSNEGYIDQDAVYKNSPWFNPEKAIEEYLGYPQKAGVAAAENIDPKTGWHFLPTDNIRHSVSSYKTAKGISDKVSPYVGNFYGNLAGTLGANVLGLAHEIQNLPNQMDPVFKGERPLLDPFIENAHDLYNNFVGAKQVFSGMSPEAAVEYLKQQSKKGKLAKGTVDDNAYHGNPVLPKEERVLNDNTRVVREEGGALAKFQNVGPVTPNTLNANDFIYSPEELSKFKGIYDQRFARCEEGNAQCLEQANNYYNLYVAPKLNMPNTWQIAEKMGITTGDTNPRMKEYGKTPDSWDLPGLYKKAGAKVYLAASPDKPFEQQEMLNKMSPQERKDYWKKMNLPMGTLVNFGTTGLDESHGKGIAYNTTQGLVPANHSARVTGYDPEGVPYIYDFGKLTPITDPTFSFPLVSITAPQDIQGYTFDSLNKQNKLQADRMFPLKLNTKNAEYDEDEYDPFINSLTKNKESYANALGMTNEEYDDYAKHAAALALTETGGGDDTSVRWKGIIPVPSYVTDKMGMGDTKGITQINAKVLFGKKSLADKLSVLGITKDNFDPWNSDHIAAATMALLKDNRSVQNANAKKAGNKADLSEAEKTYYQWSMPGTLTKGQAKGDSEKIKRYLENYGKIQANFQTSASPIAEKEMGGEAGWLDEYNDFKYGGVKQYKGLPKGTTKNLVRGINKLFLPDPKLFGPFGRKVFDPNSKFEDGGWLDEYQVGGRFGDLRPTQDNTRVVIPNLPKKLLTKAEQQEAKQYAVKQASRDLQKANEKLAKIQRIRASDKAQQEQGFPTTRQEWADQTQAIGDKISLQNLPVVGEYIPDLLDVTGDIGSMASSLASAPLRAQQEDSYMPYLKAIGAPLFQGALAGVGAKNTGDFVNNLVNPFAGMNIKGLRRKPSQNIELDPNHYEFSNPEMTDYFAQQPQRDLAEARLYEKKAAEKENWLQQLEQDRLDALASQYSDDELEGGIELFGDSDDPFGAYENAVNASTPANVPNPSQAFRDYLQPRDIPNIEPLRVTPDMNQRFLGQTIDPQIEEARRLVHNRQRLTPEQGALMDQHGIGDRRNYVPAPTQPVSTSVPPPPTYEEYLNNASHAGTTPLSREQYDYINNTPTPPLQSVFPTDASGWGDPSAAPTWGTPAWNQQPVEPSIWGTPQTVPIKTESEQWSDIAETLKQNKKNTEAVENVKQQLGKNKNVTGRVQYHSVDETATPTLLDKSAIPSSDKIDSLIGNFEDVLNHMPQDHALRNKVVTQLEDLKSTKWLRENYAKELKEKGLKPKENLSIITSNAGGYSSLKHLVDEEGNIIGSVDINPKGYVGSSGLAHKYHGFNFERNNFPNAEAAQTALEERLKTRNLEALENSFNQGILNRNDFETYKAGTEAGAKKEAAEIMQRLQENNANKYGEALYRGIHHGIKDTKGPLKSQKHFVETTLKNPITGDFETARRGSLGWKSWMRQGKVADELDPSGFEQFRILKSALPYVGAGALGANALQEEKYGGWLDSYK